MDSPTVAGIGKKNGKFDKWEIESAANTLVEAEKVKRNKPLLALVLKELKSRKSAHSDAIGQAKCATDDEDEE